MTEHEVTLSPIGRAELESAASRALECVKAKGFHSVEVRVVETSGDSLEVVWGFDSGKDLALQRAHEAPFLEAETGRYRRLAEKLEKAGLDLGDWNDDNLSSALSAAHDQDEGVYMRCFREVFVNS